MAQLSLVGYERSDSRTVEVVVVKKGADRRGEGMPPDGTADNDGLVILEVAFKGFDGRPLFGLHLATRLIDNFVIGAIVRLYNLDLGYVCPKPVGYVLGHLACVARERKVKQQGYRP